MPTLHVIIIFTAHTNTHTHTLMHIMTIKEATPFVIFEVVSVVKYFYLFFKTHNYTGFQFINFNMTLI